MTKLILNYQHMMLLKEEQYIGTNSMWEYITTMISAMFTDRLWMWTAIAGAIFGAMFIAYMRNTRIAVWVYGKWDATIDFFRDRYGWTWLNQDLGAWRKVHPQLTKEIEDIKSRLDKLENKK